MPHWSTRLSDLTPRDEEIKRTPYLDWIRGWAKMEVLISPPSADCDDEISNMYRALNNAGLERICVKVTDLTLNPSWESELFDHFTAVGDCIPDDIDMAQAAYNWMPTYGVINEIFERAYPAAKFDWPLRPPEIEEWNNALRAWILERDGLLKLNRAHYPK